LLVGAKEFSFFKSFLTSTETHPALCLTDTMCTFRGMKRIVHEAAHPSPPSADVKNDWSCNSSPS